ncbi:MAG: glycosyltransferase [Verrucomicrobiota bacterium]|jgi:UDP-N-acetylglucosamine:LPS N-acetylglucosamine transferase
MNGFALRQGHAYQVLFISGSISLGHVTRDLAIAAALRRLYPSVHLAWLAADPAREVLKVAGEELVPESVAYSGETDFAEKLARGFSLQLTNPIDFFRSPRILSRILSLVRAQKANLALFKALTGRERIDLIIGDEAYDIMLGVARDPALKPAPLAMIFDFVGLDTTSRNPLEWLSVQLASWYGVRLVRRFPCLFDLTLMVGEEADVADKPFGLFLPNRRELARAVTKFIGYVCPFAPADYRDRTGLRQRLGYGPEPLVICSIGGTAIGKPLLELCGRSYPVLKRKIPNLQMVVVCGPRLSADALVLPEGIKRRGYVHRLYEHLAACDLAIVQGGGTTTLELTALRRPFIYFPLEGHFEQRFHVAKRIERHRAGVRLEFSGTTPEHLASVVLGNIGTEVTYPSIATNGAQHAAELLSELLERSPSRRSTACA